MGEDWANMSMLGKTGSDATAALREPAERGLAERMAMRSSPDDDGVRVAYRGGRLPFVQMSRKGFVDSGDCIADDLNQLENDSEYSRLQDTIVALHRTRTRRGFRPGMCIRSSVHILTLLRHNLWLLSEKDSPSMRIPSERFRKRK